MRDQVDAWGRPFPAGFTDRADGAGTDTTDDTVRADDTTRGDTHRTRLPTAPPPSAPAAEPTSSGSTVVEPPSQAQRSRTSAPAT